VNSTGTCGTASPNNTLACLRSVSEANLFAAINASFASYSIAFVPNFDGPGGIVSDYPTKRLLRGAGKQVPLVIGTVLDEGQSSSTLAGSMDDYM
jgi:carboxylesterase type B